MTTASPSRGSPRASMAYSPAASQLTPRSKIRAMLTALDDDSGSDKENNRARPLVTHKAGLASGSPKKGTVSGAPNRRLPFRDDSSDDDSNWTTTSRYLDDKSRSRKRSFNASTANHPGLYEDDGAENAYERVKRQMLMSKSVTAQSLSVNERPALTSTQLSSSLAASGATPKRHRTVSPPSLASSPRDSPIARRRASPGLFLSPDKSLEDRVSTSVGRAQSLGAGSHGSDIDSAERNRLQALVARKRAEREAKEREARPSRSDDDAEERMPQPKQKKARHKRVVNVESEDDQDQEAATKLTQQTRPVRKASKKAIEEMKRETQRMSRNMQMTHEARTRTKFTTADLFKKLNFRQSKLEIPADEGPAITRSSSNVPSSDTEQTAKHDTPPSSPPSRGPSPSKATVGANMVDLTAVEKTSPDSDGSDGELPSLEEMLRRSKDTMQSNNEAESLAETMNISKPTEKPSLRKFAKSAKRPPINDGSDDDLEILKPHKPSRIKAFDEVPKSKAHESHSLHALKALAHLNEHHSTKGGFRESLTPGELRQKLQRRAREQAAVERAEKIQALRDKGVVVQTEEEREGEQMQIENMLERARAEAEELAKKEKEARRREDKEGDGEGDGLPDSEDEDEEYRASNDGAGDESGSGDERSALSGSDEEAENEHEEDDEIEDADGGGEADTNIRILKDPSLVDDEACEEDAEAQSDKASAIAQGEEGKDVSSGNDEGKAANIVPLKPRRKTTIESDEDDSDNGEAPPPPFTETQRTPKAYLADAFGFAQQKSPALGLSQIFGGTMAESQTQAGNMTPIQNNQDSLAFLRDLPRMDVATLGAEAYPETQVMDSQYEAIATPLKDSAANEPLFAIDTPTRTPFMATQHTDVLEATQDRGFETVFSPERPRKVTETQDTHSTVDTVLLPMDLPVARRKSRLQRGKPQVQVEASQEPQRDDGAADESSEESNAQNAFLIMKKASKKPVEPKFNNSRKEAKGMFEEQAEESDDEYAGLGGASDDDSQGEMDEETKQMIDNTGNEKLNASQVAARYHAQKLAEDEKETSRLYKDITTGGLRRKRGAGVDLLDSDDEDEAIARRRAAKQREFAKMRKALLADEKVGKIAENPKRQAFLQAIADQAEYDEINFFDAPEDSQLQLSVADSQEPKKVLAPTSGNPSEPRQDREDQGTQQKDYENRPQAHLRRINTSFKPPPPDIRRTLSELIGEPDEPVDHGWDLQCEEDKDSDNGGGSGDSDGDDPRRAKSIEPMTADDAPPPPAITSTNPRRTNPSNSRKATIDRMALNRRTSSLATNSAHNVSTSDRMAFAPPSLPIAGSFRVPSLLRRATTNNASHASPDGESQRSTGGSFSQQGGLGGMGKEGVKMGGTSKSSVNYYVRESERRKKIEEVERERTIGRQRVGRLRREGRGLKGLGGGSFE